MLLLLLVGIFAAVRVYIVVRDGGGKPGMIQCDQGTEFTSTGMDHWPYWNNVGLDFSCPGTPGDNARNEAFNGTVRRECLSQHCLVDLSDASGVLDSWRNEYNNDRPHSSLGYITPAGFRAGCGRKDDPAGAEKCR